MSCLQKRYLPSRSKSLTKDGMKEEIVVYKLRKVGDNTQCNPVVLLRRTNNRERRQKDEE